MCMCVKVFNWKMMDYPASVDNPMRHMVGLRALHLGGASINNADAMGSSLALLPNLSRLVLHGKPFPFDLNVIDNPDMVDSRWEGVFKQGDCARDTHAAAAATRPATRRRCSRHWRSIRLRTCSSWSCGRLSAQITARATMCKPRLL
jgi:hypothetical protein